MQSYQTGYRRLLNLVFFLWFCLTIHLVFWTPFGQKFSLTLLSSNEHSVLLQFHPEQVNLAKDSKTEIENTEEKV